VTSSTPKTDPRRRTWQLSRAGQDLVDRLRPEWHRREAIIQAGLSAAEQTVLSDLLQRMFVASEKLRADETVELQALSKPGIRKRARARPVNGRAVHPTASASLSRVR
jgi:hypothetical protein